jgi:hypothetical protein
MKRGKRVKPEMPAEYILLVTPHVNERTKEKVTLIALRTVTEFTAFRYELVVEPAVDGRKITLLIQGLRAPELTLPAMGPAEFRFERNDLKGAYEIVVSKHGKATDSYTVDVTGAAVKVVAVPEDRFSDIVTKKEDW